MMVKSNQKIQFESVPKNLSDLKIKVYDASLY
jgi:hypothetical protein